MVHLTWHEISHLRVSLQQVKPSGREYQHEAFRLRKAPDDV